MNGVVCTSSFNLYAFTASTVTAFSVVRFTTIGAFPDVFTHQHSAFYQFRLSHCVCVCVLWPARASTQNVPCGATTPLAVPVGWGFLRRGCEKTSLLSETTYYCCISHRKKTPTRITR
jgi:hypothetical protein